MSFFTDFRALFGQKIGGLIYPLLNPFWTPILRHHPLFLFYKILAKRSMTRNYFNVISTLLIHEFVIFYFKN